MITNYNSKCILKNVSTLIISIFLVTLPFISIKSLALKNDSYFDYIAKQAKLLNDFNFTTDNRSVLITVINFSEEVFTKESLSKLNIEELNISNINDQCVVPNPKHYLYYKAFNPNCVRGSYIATSAALIEQIVKNDNFGYTDYYSTPSEISFPTCEIKSDEVIPNYLSLLNKYSRTNDTNENDVSFITDLKTCNANFKKAFPKFVADKAKCDTSDWLIFMFEYRYNPHCSIVDISTVPREVNYYFTSWGVYKIGETPDVKTAKRIITRTKEEALPDSDPNKSQAVKDKVAKESEVFEAQKRAKEDKEFETKYLADIAAKKAEQDKIIAPSSVFINKLKYYWYNYQYQIIIALLFAIGLIIFVTKQAIRRLKIIKTKKP